MFQCYLKRKIHPNGCPVMLCEELVNVSLDDTGLPATQFSDDEDLEDVLGPAAQACHDANL